MRVRLLGGFQIRIRGREIPEGLWKLTRAKSLIKLLALAEGHHLHREQIMEMLWPEIEPDAAARNFNQALYSARQVLRQASDKTQPFLELEKGILYLCRNAGVWIDVRAFEKAAASARQSNSLEEHQQAIAMYTGDLLPEDRYDARINEYREALRQVYLSLLTNLSSIQEARQDFPGAIAALEKAAAIDPGLEEVHARLMRLYAASGHRRSALRQYHILQTYLQRELDSQPDPQTTALYQEILTGQGSIRRPARAARLHNLPSPLSHFVGREREIDAVKSLLGASRLVTLTGPGGVGKTRLAVRAAEESLQAYPDGVWLVELAPLEDSSLVPQAVARLFGLQESSEQALLPTLEEYLCTRRILIVLDNCEHLIEPCARLVERLLLHCQNLRVLATSREALNIEGEQAYLVPSMAFPHLDPLPDPSTIAGYEAVRLFVERARAAVSGFAITHQNAAHIAKICRRLDGIPLAIELAAARVSVLSVEQIAARLEADFHLLTGGSRTAPPRQQTVKASIAWSFHLLSEPEQALLRRLSVFAGGWTLEAAEAVCGDAEKIPPEVILDLLAQLVNKSLVVAEAQQGAPRYHLLELVCEFAGEWLAEADETERISSRHLDYYRAFAEKIEPALRTGQRLEGLAALRAEIDNFRAALSWSLASGLPEKAALGLRLACAVVELWVNNGLGREGRDWLEKLLPTLPENEPALFSLRAKVFFAAGYVSFAVSEWNKAARYYEKAVSAYRALANKSELALALANLGLSLMWSDESVRIDALLSESLDHARTSGGGWPLAWCLGVSAYRYLVLGDRENTQRCAEESFSLFQKVGDRWTGANAASVLGHIFRDQGDYRTALSFFESVIAASLEDNNQFQHMWAVANLGDLAYSQGQYPQMAACYQEFQEICRKIGFRAGLAWALRREGIAHRRSGETALAARCLRESLSPVTGLEYNRNKELEIKHYIEAVAGIALDTGQPAQAARLFGAAGNIYGPPMRGFYEPIEPGEHDRDAAAMRAVLGEAGYQEAWEAGSRLTLEQAFQQAKEVLTLASTEGPSAAARSEDPASSGVMANPPD